MRDYLGLGGAVALTAMASAGALAIPATSQAQAPSACQALASAAEGVLGASAVSGPGAVSYPGLDVAPGCMITFTGTGAVFGNQFQAVATKLDTMMQARGWTPDLNAEADGPTGTAMGYRKPGQAVALSVSYDTAKGVCSEDEPVASCHPTPAQMRYTITLGLRPGP